MIKRISLLARKNELTHEEFIQHWMGPHIEIVRQLPRVRGIVLNPVLPADSATEWDGIGELWFDTIEDAQAAFATDPMPRLLAEDRPKFIGHTQVYFVREHRVFVEHERAHPDPVS